MNVLVFRLVRRAFSSSRRLGEGVIQERVPQCRSGGPLGCSEVCAEHMSLATGPFSTALGLFEITSGDRQLASVGSGNGGLSFWPLELLSDSVCLRTSGRARLTLPSHSSSPPPARYHHQHH